MPGYLVYWKTFWKDGPGTEERLARPDWHSRHESFARAASRGIELWVVSQSDPTGKSGEWRILEHFEVPRQPLVETRRNGDKVWRLKGAPESARLFSLNQPDAAPVLRSLRFSGNVPIKARGALIGRYLQGPRELAPTDLTLLRKATAGLASRLTAGNAHATTMTSVVGPARQKHASASAMSHENDHQIALREMIEGSLKVEHARALKGDAGYLFNNMIAKYTLAEDSYWLSVGAEARLASSGFDFDARVARISLYGKKSPYCYEHAIPATIVRKQLLDAHGSDRTVRSILDQAGPVAILLREEDALLRKEKLTSKMPAGWKWGQDPLARYRAVGIRLSERRVKMKGAIKR